MFRFRNMLSFDAQTGILVCEAGVLLQEILDVFVPRGFFPIVTPGTKFVTVGGMIAADVHGKNHHQAGSFRSCVEWIDVLLGDGSVLRCSRAEYEAFFGATIGGMGLTGIIARAAIRLMPVETAYISQRTLYAPDLDSAMALLQAAEGAPYVVGWVDCLATGGNLGRSLIYLGEHVRRDQLPEGLRDQAALMPRFQFPVPIDFPDAALNTWTVRAFNTFYLAKGRLAASEHIVHYDGYFYPLDSIRNWNRIYGRRGFVQYQCVMPKESSAIGLRQVMQVIADSGLGSFLSVLKLLGAGAGMLSFPIEGYTLALDFPVCPDTFQLLDRLDRIVLKCGGRLYLVKDARMSKPMFRESYTEWEAFAAIRARYGAERFVSRGSAMHDAVRAPILILGAASDIALATARVFAAGGHPVYLAARSPQELEGVRADIALRYNVPVSLHRFDVLKVDQHAGFMAQFDPSPGIVLCAVGLMPEQSACEESLELAERVMQVNYVGPSLLLETAAARLLALGVPATIIGISSAAGDRGRAVNYCYGSAKAGFTAYLLGLRQRLSSSNIAVVTVIPGPVRTKMTRHMVLPKLLTSSPEDIGRRIRKAVLARKDIVYSKHWALLMFVIQHMPESIFKRMRIQIRQV